MKLSFIIISLGFLFAACSPGDDSSNNTNNINNTNNVNNINNINNSNNLNNTNNTNNLNNTNNTNNLNNTNNTNNLNNTNNTNNLNNTNNTNTPIVQIVSPNDGDFVDNPVLFVIGAQWVDTVQILAEDWPLSDPWDPAQSLELEYTFQGTGTLRTINLKGFDSSGNEVAQDSITITVNEDEFDPGVYVGQMYNTYYYFPREEDFAGADDTTLYDSSCNPVAVVPADFSDTVCIQGSGILDTGTVISYASTCNCGRVCPTGGTICYMLLDPVQYPWGMGSFNNPIEPLRSWAVDNSIISAGSVIYAEQWDGVNIPAIDGIGGFVHDGCFRADDTGGWINDYHYDFNAGTHDMWQHLETVYPTYSYFDVYVDTPKCAYLNP